MSQRDAFDVWLDKLTYLSEEETSALPVWQQPIAFVHQFAVNSANDGAGSLFYNHPDCAEAVARSLDGIGETEMARKICAIADVLAKSIETDTPDIQTAVLEQIQHGAASSAAEELGRLLDDRWLTLYAKLEECARSNGWRP